MTLEQVLEEIEKDRPFYGDSGGVTLSGGEPLMQAEFSSKLLRMCKLEGLHTVLETSGQAPWEPFRDVLKHVDLLFFDLKDMDSWTHRKLTGASNELILGNLERASKLGIPISIRVPVVPGYNDRPENFALMGESLSNLRNIEEVRLLPYHGFAESKYLGLGKRYELRCLKPPRESEMRQLMKLLEEHDLVVRYDSGQ